MEKTYIEKYFHFFPESDMGVRIKTDDGEVLYSLKTLMILIGNSLRIEVYAVGTSGEKLVCVREYDGIEGELKQFPSAENIKKLFGGRTKAVANNYPIHSKISKMSVSEFYEYIEENMGVYI